MGSEKNLYDQRNDYKTEKNGTRQKFIYLISKHAWQMDFYSLFVFKT